ncbi:MAG: hypothetical protein OHK0015_21630 [Chloroflexi bacterium OHK40]|jgi:hypothetical protein
MEEQSPVTGHPEVASPHFVVTRMPDGRYCVAYTNGVLSRRSYTPSLEQVIRQAQLAGGLPIRTDDAALRQRCQEVALRLI